jgi:hypothetical protein
MALIGRRLKRDSTDFEEQKNIYPQITPVKFASLFSGKKFNGAGTD